MKRSIFLAAVATLAAGSAFAQSSVTIYGRLNMTGERFTANQKTLYLLNNNASRFGFKGVEDLGGGMKASFLMESGFSPDTGAAASTFWGRESWVALSGDFGKVRLGNMGPGSAYFTTADYVSMHNHDTGTSEDQIYMYPGNKKNMIAYTSPSMSGLVVDAQVGLSEAAQIGRTYILTGNYDAGPLHAGLSYLQSGAGVSASPIPASFIYGNAAIGGPGTAYTKTKEYGARILYELGDLTVGGYYVRDNGYFGLGTTRNSFRASAMYVVGPGEIHLNIGYAAGIKGNNINGDDVKQYTAAYNYNLSKRTKVYTYYTVVRDPRGTVSQNTGVAKSYGTFALGLRHNF